MRLTSHLLLPEAQYSTGLLTTPSHPQLRDLLACPPEHPDSVVVVCYDLIARHSLLHNAEPSFTKLKFFPSTLSYGCGLIAVGGQLSELAIKSPHPKSTWCHQVTNSSSGSINNSIFIGPSPLRPHQPRLLISNNDSSIKIYDVAGDIPDYASARRRREKRRNEHRGSAAALTRVGRSEWGGEVDATMALSEENELGREETNVDSSSSEVEEDGTYDTGGPCRLVAAEGTNDLHFETAINHTSVSPDGRRLVAVGDTNEIFLYDITLNGKYEFVHSFEASEDASFSSDWSQTSDKFAVASQDGYVHVYDVRSLPPSGSGSSPFAPRKLATLKTTQHGPAGAARKVKFSPGSRVDGELLAFNEHRSKVHIVDARTFDQSQIVEVIPPNASYSTGGPIPSLPPSRRPPRPDDYDPRSGSGLSGDALMPSLGPEDLAFRRLLQGATGLSLEALELRQRMLARPDDFSRGVEVTRDAGGSRRRSPPIVVRSRRQGGQETDEDDDDDGDDVDDDDDDDEEECPPESFQPSTGTSTTPSTTTASASSLLARLLPDPRQPTTSVHSAIGTDNLVSFLPPESSTNSSYARSPCRPNLSGYAPLTTFSSYVSPGRAGARATGYQPTSRYFPLESTPTDLLGLDWDEWGERIVVATEERVWEWEVDTRARRCFGEFAWR